MVSGHGYTNGIWGNCCTKLCLNNAFGSNRCATGRVGCLRPRETPDRQGLSNQSVMMDTDRLRNVGNEIYVDMADRPKKLQINVLTLKQLPA